MGQLEIAVTVGGETKTFKLDRNLKEGEPLDLVVTTTQSGGRAGAQASVRVPSDRAGAGTPDPKDGGPKRTLVTIALAPAGKP